jgi:integrase
MAFPPIKISKSSVGEAQPAPRPEGVDSKGDPLRTPDAFYWDTELRGFGLRVTPAGVKSYVVQYRMKGQPAKRITIGKHGADGFTPAMARQDAERILSGVKRGEDPADAAKRALKDARLTFAGFLEEFRDDCLKEEWEDSWQDSHRALELHALPVLKNKPLASIDADDIALLMRSGKLPDHKATARKVWAVLSRLFSFAVQERRIDAAANPMIGLRPPKTPKPRRRVLSPDEVIAAWQASYTISDPFGACVRLLFATLQRRNEVAGMPWSELGQDSSVWIITPDRAKNNEEHLLPLNALALAELDRIGWKRRGLVLPNSAGGALNAFSKSKTALDAAMLPILQKMADERADALGEDHEPVTLPRWTLHDIRRTGSTMLQALGIPIEVADRVLNHKTDEAAKGSRKAYFTWKYEAEKREAMDRWSAHLARLIAGEGSVVSLRGAAIKA